MLSAPILTFERQASESDGSGCYSCPIGDLGKVLNAMK